MIIYYNNLTLTFSKKMGYEIKMSEDLGFEIKNKDGWKSFSSASNIQLGLGLHFFLVPLFILLCCLTKIPQNSFGDSFIWFARVYLPYALIFGVISYVVGKNLKGDETKKRDQAVFMNWTSIGIGLLALASSFQMFGIFSMVADDGLEKREKMILVGFSLLLDAVIAFIAVKYPKQITDWSNNAITKHEFSLGKYSWIPIILLCIPLAFITGFHHLTNFALFLAGIFGGQLFLLLLFLIYPVFLKIYIWHMRIYWDTHLRK